MDRFKTVLQTFMYYLAIAGLVTFTLFIHEEAIQQAVWGTWPAQDAKQWQQVKIGIELIDKINTSMKIINYAAGWVQPLALISYHYYSKSTDFYIESLRVKCFVNDPKLFDGEQISVKFTPKSIKKISETNYLATNKQLSIQTNFEVDFQFFKDNVCTGVVIVSGGRVILNINKINYKK